ncbi:MAG: hypothetical protein RLZZ79_648 [Actinomycetota bacterium]
MRRFDGRTIIVTGSSGGIGKSVTDLLLNLGARVLAVDVAPPVNNPTSETTNFKYFQCDLSKSDELDKLIAEIAPHEPDSLVALAGIVVSGELISQSDSSVEQVIQTNLISQINLAKRIIATWIKGDIKGNIVFVSSWVDHVPWPGITPYSASKAGLVAACRGIAREFATRGIRANLIAPGIVDVGMAAKQWREEPDYRARAGRAIPLGRLQQPEEVATGISFLLSDEASYMTGSTLLIDGGASLYPMDPEEVR